MTTNQNKRLYRAPDRVLGGVCSGLAEYFGLNVSHVRLATLILFFLGTLSFWIYILCWIIIPEAPKRINA